MKCIYLLSVICISFLFSCGGVEQEKKFFDIPEYFNREIIYIKSSFSGLSKSSKYNGHSSYQTFTVKDINWEKEFAIFIECDINKPIYFANMKEMDSPASDTKSHNQTYQCEYSKASIRRVDIFFDSIAKSATSVKSIRITINKSNLISATNIEAYYRKGELYSISGEQTIKILGSKNSFFIEGRFIK